MRYVVLVYISYFAWLVRSGISRCCWLYRRHSFASACSFWSTECLRLPCAPRSTWRMVRILGRVDSWIPDGRWRRSIQRRMLPAIECRWSWHYRSRPSIPQSACTANQCLSRVRGRTRSSRSFRRCRESMMMTMRKRSSWCSSHMPAARSVRCRPGRGRGGRCHRLRRGREADRSGTVPLWQRSSILPLPRFD